MTPRGADEATAQWPSAATDVGGHGSCPNGHSPADIVSLYRGEHVVDMSRNASPAPGEPTSPAVGDIRPSVRQIDPPIRHTSVGREMHPSENWLGLPIHVNEDGTRGDPYVDPDGSILAQARAAAYEAARPSRRDRIDIAYHLSFGGPMLRTYEYARLFGTPPSADRGRGTGSYR